jgi:protein SERAC1
MRATLGIIFLGTPHRGSSAANLGSTAARVARYSLLVNPNTRLLQKLQLHNDFLSEKSHQFSKICSSFKIFSFYETQKTKGIMVDIANSPR